MVIYESQKALAVYVFGNRVVVAVAVILWKISLNARCINKRLMCGFVCHADRCLELENNASVIRWMNVKSPEAKLCIHRNAGSGLESRRQSSTSSYAVTRGGTEYTGGSSLRSSSRVDVSIQTMERQPSSKNDEN